MHALGHCLPDQKSVLLQIRTQITYNSSESTKLVLWDEGADCCRWPGLSCNDASGYITTLDLSYEGSIMSGFNISLLSKLPSLSVIRLDGVKFSAPFPDFFTNFTNLTVLSLVACNFSGTVPHKVFQVPTLQTIDLTYNFMLGGSLPDFPENGLLQSLTLYNTNFSGNLPESIGNLRLLSHIDLSDCYFSGPIPASIIKLSKLVELRLSENSFSGPIPASLFFLPSLQTLLLDGNKLSGHITELRNVTSPLESLDLTDNNLEGTIPSFFFRLQSLTYLHLSSNNFFGQMIDLQNVTSPLQYLDLSSNDIEGTIPPFLFQLQNLTELDLSSNKFNGIVYLTKFKRQYIDTLDFSNNNLVIETTISTSELPLLPQFGELYLASCNLQTIPEFLKSQSKLSWLDLSNNTISGEIPNWIWGIGNGQLYGLNLSHNRLTHMKEPMEYGSPRFLDLNSNMLSGQIPRPPPKATYLDFSNNNFSMIPLDFADQIPYLVSFFSIAKNRVVPRVGSTFVCLAPRKANRPRTVLGSIRRSGVHSIASVPSLDLLDDVNFFKWVLKYGSDDFGQIVSLDDICSLAPGEEVFVGVIIVGSCILTYREHTKDPSTPTRVFASPFATLNTTVLFEKIDKLKLARFSEALGADFALGSL
nr:receptor-like protein 12 [Ipomoea batatas]